jgi:single-strand DNA-binding protein
MDLNRSSILGRLTQDPEIKTTPNGQSVCTIGVATGRSWTDQSGNKQEKTEFHNCVLWGKLADIAGQYLSKGRRVFMEGRLETRNWTGQDGVKKYRTEIIVSNMIMLDGPRGAGAPQAAAAPMPVSNNAPVQAPVDDEEIKVEDIPF